jgi:hypothetical protein
LVPVKNASSVSATQIANLTPFRNVHFLTIQTSQRPTPLFEAAVAQQNTTFLACYGIRTSTTMPRQTRQKALNHATAFLLVTLPTLTSPLRV